MAKGYTHEALAIDRATKVYKMRILAAADVDANGYSVVAGVRGVVVTKTAEGDMRIQLPQTHTRLLGLSAIRSAAGHTNFDTETVSTTGRVNLTFQDADTPADTDPDGETIFVEITVQDGARA
jgi:hypothetical protein